MLKEIKLEKIDQLLSCMTFHFTFTFLTRQNRCLRNVISVFLIHNIVSTIRNQNCCFRVNDDNPTIIQHVFCDLCTHFSANLLRNCICCLLRLTLRDAVPAKSYQMNFACLGKQFHNFSAFLTFTFR